MMQNVKLLFLLIFVLTIHWSLDANNFEKQYIYNIRKLDNPIKMDGRWDKPQWKKTKSLKVKNFLGKVSKFRPDVKVKMMYDDNHLYIIFLVRERNIKSVEHEINGNVWEDSCVEFFFSPDTNKSNQYFNLEVNCIGIPLLHYQLIPRKNSKNVDVEDIKKIEIAHSLTDKIIDRSFKKPVTWTIEYKIPITILRKYSYVTQPHSGIKWKANFYKIAEKGINPHWISWSLINNKKVDFHVPQFFGTLYFE